MNVYVLYVKVPGVERKQTIYGYADDITVDVEGIQKLIVLMRADSNRR